MTLSAPGCAAYALDMPAGSQPLYWEVSAQGFDRKPPSEALAQGLEVSREYLDAEGRPVTTVKQGDVVTVSISARSHGGSVSDAVIVDLLPGGFEMVLNSDIKGQNPSGEPGYKSVDRREDRMIVFRIWLWSPSCLRIRPRREQGRVHASASAGRSDVQP